MVSNYKFSDYWAVTMFSFTNELLAGRASALELIDQVLSQGLSQFIEIDGPMHFRNYPHSNPAELADLKAVLTKYRAGISLVGGTVDRAVSSTRMVDSASVVESVKAQLALASEIGAFGLRMMVGGLTLEELQEIAPVAEHHGVKILFEMHGVMTPDSPAAVECLELVKTVNSSHVRLMFDSSLFMTELPHGLLKALAASGVSDTDAFAQKWKHSTLSDFRNWLIPQIDSFSPTFKAFIPTLFSRLGHARPEEYGDYLPYIESVHLKYWELDEDMSSTDALLKVLSRQNYSGYLTSEWGGHEWYSLNKVSAFAATSNHRELVERSFNLAH
jgi:hypothetical protein